MNDVEFYECYKTLLPSPLSSGRSITAASGSSKTSADDSPSLSSGFLPSPSAFSSESTSGKSTML